jgi:hypothetical protein
MNELPQQICDRVPNTFYLYENRTRFWNGKRLQCEHKKPGSQCPTCNPERWKQTLQQIHEYQQKKKERIQERKREYQQKNKERVNQRQREYRQKNKERVKEREREYRQKNKERMQKQMQEYYQENKERMQKQMQEHYQKNKEQIQERGREYRQKNKERIQERGREYYQKNKERGREYRQKNKERIQERGREYRQKNKEQLKEREREWRQKNKEQLKEKHQEYRQKNKEQLQEYRQKNKERIQERGREYRQKNKEKLQEYRQKNKEQIQERRQEWRRTSDKNRCNDLCIDILHSQTEFSFKFKNKFGCDDGSVRVCYGCAIADIRSTEKPELKQEKKDYYNIHTTKTRYLFRIEYAILCHLNDYPLIDEMNQEVLNIHDKDIVSIVGKTATIEKRPDRAYLMDNNLIFFEIDETGVYHEKGIERLLHLRNRLQTTFEDDRPINLHVFRFNTNEYEENSMVERREFPSGVEQKEAGYVLSEHGCNVIENDFIPLFENVYQDCREMVDIENDKNLMIYEINVDDMDEMIESYVDQNENITVSDYFMML